ncbi:hypothetical protein TanjilG_15203 [Lupinus angustifolius]|uniref:F-box domain-containing protein n=1 Tax=Lupinus angustifolius TaxID=3871 RepID=A0A1J7HP81_LUPAN|nr:hypothetical protein TanjilG_15203 [Lupinus angustifolius]
MSPTYHRYPPLSRESYRDLLKVLEGQQVVFPQRLLDIILLELGLYPNEDLDEVIVYDPHCMTRRHHAEPSSSLHHKSTNCEMRNVVSGIKQLVNGENKKGDYFSEDILESILGWLCPADYLRCRAVCSWWRTVMGNAIRSKHCKTTLQLPLLMLNFRPAYDKDSPCFYSLSKQKLQFPNKPIYPVTQNCIGSIDGWLIMYDKDSMNDFLDAVDDNYDTIYLASFYYFLNPVSDDTVPLCDDKPWALLDAEKFIHDIEIHDGKLYVVISSSSIESIMVYDFQLDEDYSGPKAQKLVVHEVQSFLNLPTVSTVNFVTTVKSLIKLD